MPQGKAQSNGAPNHSLPKRPTFDSNDLSEALRRYDRAPFLDLLAAWMECAPTPEDIIDFAKKKPDLWVKALTDLAKIGGYTEKQEVLHTVNVNQMSDSQLEDRARELAASMGMDFNPRLLSPPKAAQSTPIANEYADAYFGKGQTIDHDSDHARGVSGSRKRARRIP